MCLTLEESYTKWSLECYADLNLTEQHWNEPYTYS